MNSDSALPKSMPSAALVNDSESEPLSLGRVESLVLVMLVRQLDSLIAQTELVNSIVRDAAVLPSMRKRMQSLLLPKLETLQMEQNYIVHMLLVWDAPKLSSMLASDESYSAPYTGPGSAKPFSGKQESE